MPPRMNFAAELESYLHHLAADRHNTVAETSRYGYLQTLLNAAGLHGPGPAIHALIHPSSSGAGIPDLGLFSAEQTDGDRPAHGVVEVKPASANLFALAQSEQVRRYLLHYGQVLVTNYYQFLLVTMDEHGAPRLEEQYRLAADEAEFWAATALPGPLAQRHAAALLEYLSRVMRRGAPLRTPQEVAQMLASYAREARARLDQGGVDLLTLARIRRQLEEALGLHFEAQRGEAFFRSSLVQTLFYGVFSAWVLWHEERPTRIDAFDLWRDTRRLSIPAVRLLFEQFSAPSQLDPLNLEEVLRWTASALNRVERGAFFARFRQGEAVQYFYEPFLEAFDPELRTQLGVWYTPPEVVDYMVARVDAALRDELGIAAGLADPRVTVLDPCCGTGAYLVSIMRLVYARLAEQVGPALAGQLVAEAARTRLFGFEILPAPFVVAHLQIGALLAGEFHAPLRGGERAGVYLTNALTGWVREQQPPLADNFLARESEAAAGVKQEQEILVVLGNPPYSGYAGLAIDEERNLVEAYRTTVNAPRPQGQGLNDLYVRFYRMAERRIVEMSGRGVVCFISNYSWLDGLSHTGMRERYLSEFDTVTIDSLNGDKYRTGKTTPDGAPDPSIFSTPFNREGIQVGTAIALLVRRNDHQTNPAVCFRDLWGTGKLAQLRAETPAGPPDDAYTTVTPAVALGYPFMPRQVAADYLAWPRLPELFPTYFAGVQTKRDEDLVDIVREALVQRLQKYFDPVLDDVTVRQFVPKLMQDSNRFDHKATRDYLKHRGFLEQNVVRHCYRPFDVRWLYWEPETRLLGEKSPDYFPHVRSDENVWMVSQRRPRREWSVPQFIRSIGSLDLMDRGASCFPLYLYDEDPGQLFQGRRENLSAAAQRYLGQVGAGAAALFYHTLAVLHAPLYRAENAGALRQDWPRVPLPAAGAALAASAALGERVAALLDAERPVPGVTTGEIEPALRAVAVFDFVGGAPDLAVSAGWGYAGQGGVTMPGRGRVAERVGEDGDPTLDIYLNATTCWRNVPLPVWEYTLGGYQVLKKWLSYREAALLGRPLTVGEVAEFAHIARRIAALLALADALDANYRRVAAHP